MLICPKCSRQVDSSNHLTITIEGRQYTFCTVCSYNELVKFLDEKVGRPIEKQDEPSLFDDLKETPCACDNCEEEDEASGEPACLDCEKA